MASSYLGRLARPGITRSLALLVVKPYGITVKKALKNKVETCICAVWLAHLSYLGRLARPRAIPPGPKNEEWGCRKNPPFLGQLGVSCPFLSF
jgi:hypothetical protein